jgi:hypothetical protein
METVFRSWFCCRFLNRIFHVLTLAIFSIYTVSNLKENKVLIDEELFI